MDRAPLCLYCAILIGVASAQVRRAESLLLRERVRLTGVVTDSNGEPLEDAWLNHAGDEVRNIRTDPRGRFAIETRAPAIVIRKNGYQSKFLRVSKDAELVVVLGPAARMRECEASAALVSLRRWGATFHFHRVSGVHVGEQVNDIDYGYCLFSVKTRTGRVTIQHGTGPLWSIGLPFDEDVWSAREYTEISYAEREPFGVVDARGESSDGKCWRLLGRFGETAQYRNVPELSAALLDRVIDGACASAPSIKPQERR